MYTIKTQKLEEYPHASELYRHRIPIVSENKTVLKNKLSGIINHLKEEKAHLENEIKKLKDLIDKEE